MSKIYNPIDKTFLGVRISVIGRISLHLLYWGIILVMTTNQFGRIWQKESHPNLDGRNLMIFCHNLTNIISFYWLGYYILPKFLYQDKYLKSIVYYCIYWVILCYVTQYYFLIIIEYFGPAPPYITSRIAKIVNNGIYGYFFIPEVALFFWAHSSSYVLTPLLLKGIRDQQRRAKRLVELAKEKSQIELDFLRAQINPHFLFNTFNNLYSLILTKNESAITVLTQLSDMMRYTVYETSGDFVRLERELNFIDDYINIECIRLMEPPLIAVNYPDQVGDIGIPPMILITFIENVFKHGLNPLHGDGTMLMDISVGTNPWSSTPENKALNFSCLNSVPDKAPKEVEKQAKNSVKGGNSANGYTAPRGVGLENIRKRLDILFANEYSLETGMVEHKGEPMYKVLLTIPLKEIPLVKDDIYQRSYKIVT